MENTTLTGNFDKQDHNRSLIIVGDGEFAEIAYEYFTFDSDYDIVAFAVESAFRKKSSLYGLPIVDLETLEKEYDPESHWVYVAVTYTQLNRVRARLYQSIKDKGYRLANYISSRAFVWRNAELGENVFIFEHNVIQHHVKIGNNVVLWSGNHIGHRSVIGDHCYISSHVVISGYCHIEPYCFLGVNCTVADNVTIARDCLIGANALITQNTEPGLIYKGGSAEKARVGSLRFFGVRD